MTAFHILVEVDSHQAYLAPYLEVRTNINCCICTIHHSIYAFYHMFQSLHVRLHQMSLQIYSLLPPCLGAIKTEAEEMEDDEQYAEAEKEREIVPKEEAEGASDDGMEEGFDEPRTEEDDDEERDGEGDEEGDTLNEPQDLSLVDYSRYDSATPPDAHAAAAAAGAEGTYVHGAVAPRIQATGKLNCDICGLSCVSINVLLVHKRSHTGKRRNRAQTPDLKHNSCAIITLLIALGDNTLH